MCTYWLLCTNLLLCPIICFLNFSKYHANLTTTGVCVCMSVRGVVLNGVGWGRLGLGGDSHAMFICWSTQFLSCLSPSPININTPICPIVYNNIHYSQLARFGRKNRLNFPLWIVIIKFIAYRIVWFKMCDKQIFNHGNHSVFVVDYTCRATGADHDHPLYHLS